MNRAVVKGLIHEPLPRSFVLWGLVALLEPGLAQTAPVALAMGAVGLVARALRDRDRVLWLIWLMLAAVLFAALLVRFSLERDLFHMALCFIALDLVACHWHIERVFAALRREVLRDHR